MSRRAQLRRQTRWDIIAIIAVIGFILIEPRYQAFTETRFYRDWNGLTPFRDVTVSHRHLDHGALIVGGSMVKVRCTFDRLTGYVQLENGIAIRVGVDTSVEDARGVTGNRPASSDAQSWGPWALRYHGGLGQPVAWKIFAHHINCPGEPRTQNNLFAAGPWAGLDP